MKLLQSKKGDLGVQTVFFIMMAIFMMAIIVFGFSKIFFVNETLSEMEALDIKKEIESAYIHCEDPLAKGDKKTVKFKSNVFNSVCVASGEVDNEDFMNVLDDNNIGYDLNDAQFLLGVLEDLNNILVGGHNVILFNSKFAKNSDESYILKEFTIVDSFKADLASDRVSCDFDLEGDGVFEMTLIC